MTISPVLTSCARCHPDFQCADCHRAAHAARAQAIAELQEGHIGCDEFTARFLDAGRWTNPGDAEVARQGAWY